MESINHRAPATLIVGVSGDLLEVARELGRQGERIGLLSRNTQLLYRYKERLEGWGVECEAFAADVSESQSVLNAMMSFSAWSPRADRLIYNVGVLSTETAATVTESELSRVMGANFFGFVNCFQLVQPMFQRLGQGHAVVVSSVAALEPETQPVAYAASKASLKIYVNSLRKEVVKYRIRISEIYLGQIATSDGPRDLTCEEIVAGVCHVIQSKPERFLIGEEIQKL